MKGNENRNLDVIKEALWNELGNAIKHGESL